MSPTFNPLLTAQLICVGLGGYFLVRGILTSRWSRTLLGGCFCLFAFLLWVIFR